MASTFVQGGSAAKRRGNSPVRCKFPSCTYMCCSLSAIKTSPSKTPPWHCGDLRNKRMRAWRLKRMYEWHAWRICFNQYQRKLFLSFRIHLNVPKLCVPWHLSPHYTDQNLCQISFWKTFFKISNLYSNFDLPENQMQIFKNEKMYKTSQIPNQYTIFYQYTFFVKCLCFVKYHLLCGVKSKI